MAFPLIGVAAIAFAGVAGGAIISQRLDNSPTIGEVNQPITALPFNTIMGYTLGAVILIYAARSMGLLGK